MTNGHKGVTAMENKRLKKAREKRNLTQEQLANIIGISQSMIARIEAGQREPRTPVKLKLARFFGTTVEWLFYEHDNDCGSLSADGATG